MRSRHDRPAGKTYRDAREWRVGARARSPRSIDDRGSRSIRSLAWGWSTAGLTLIVFGFVFAVAVGGSGPARAETCQRSEFEAVVDEAGAVLRELNQKNKPALQDRLRQLRDKRGWSNDQFMREAAPFVRDDQIDAYDQQSGEHLARITAMGQDSEQKRAADCNLLAELRAKMTALVEVQIVKWNYIFAKLDRELAK